MSLNLLQRLNMVRKAVDYIQKDRNVSTGASGSYKAISHDMVTAMTRDHLIANGVIFFPSLVASKMSPPFKADGKLWLYEATYDFKFCNIDDRADFETVRIEAHANDNADKAPGKALSYATKYAILKVLNIETGEDEESRAPSALDITDHITAIHDAQDMDALKTAYTLAFNIVSAARDKDAQREIIAAKDAVKARLTKAAA